MDSTRPKLTRSVALDQDVARASARAARAQNRSFSNYVETVLARALAEPFESDAAPCNGCENETPSSSQP